MLIKSTNLVQIAISEQKKYRVQPNHQLRTPGLDHLDLLNGLTFGEMIPGKSLVGSISRSTSTPDVYVGLN